MSKKSNQTRLRKAELERSAEELRDISVSLDDAWSHFNNITDPELIDACVFEISALRSRYSRVLNRYKTFFL